MQLWRFGSTLALGLLASGALPACNDGSGSAQGPFVSGLPGDQRAGSFTDADYDRFCRALVNYYAAEPSYREAACRFSGVVSAGFSYAIDRSSTDMQLREVCTDAQKRCLGEPLSLDAGTAPEAMNGVRIRCNRPAPNCSASVSELEACMTESGQRLEQLVDSIPRCNRITVADVQGSNRGMMSLPPTPACDTLQSKCPGFL